MRKQMDIKAKNKKKRQEANIEKKRKDEEAKTIKVL